MGSVKDLPLTMDWKRAGVVTKVKEQVYIPVPITTASTKGGFLASYLLEDSPCCLCVI